MFLVRSFLTKDIDPRLVDFAKSGIGKISIFILFCLCNTFVLLPQHIAEIYVIQYIFLVLALCVFFQEYRGRIIIVSNVLFFVVNPFWFLKLSSDGAIQYDSFFHINTNTAFYYGLNTVYLGFALCLIFVYQKVLTAALFKRPVLTNLMLLAVFIGIAETLPFNDSYRSAIWLFIVVYANSFWVFSFALKDKEALSKPFTQLSLFHPVWFFGRAPIVKSLSFYQKNNSKNEDGYATSQIKALKLAIEACFCMLVYILILNLLYPMLGFSSFDDLIINQNFYNYSSIQCFIALVVSFFEQIFKHLAIGGCAVSIARMAGFQFLRNTYKPFQSKSIADFWNRFQFYFKELLAELFFYPTFLRFFKNNTKLRIAFATFMATFVGNMLYHMLRLVILIPQVGLLEFFVRLQTYAFYCLLLSAGIIASQLRNKKVNNPTFLQQSWNLTVIIGFFCFVHIFDDMEFERKLSDCFLFFFHLFGLV